MARNRTTTHNHTHLALEVLKQFRLIYGSVREHFRSVEEICGISGSQLWILREVDRAPGIGVSTLASKLSIHQSTCSQLVEKAVRGGFVMKLRSIEDRRRVGLKLSRKGEAALTKAPGPAEGLLPEALLALSDTTLRKLELDLNGLIGQLKARDERYREKPLADL